MTAGFYSMHSPGYSPWICTNIPPKFGAQTEGSAWILLKSFSSKSKIFWNFIDYFDTTFTQNLKQNLNWYLKYSKGIFGQTSHFFPLFLFTWFPPMPWQLKNPTFSFSLRPMLSKHWLVSTFLIWRKERDEIFLKIFPGPARFVEKIAICEQITFPNSHGMVLGLKWPQSSSMGHLSLSHEGIQDDYPKYVKIPILFLPVYPGKPQNIPLGSAVGGLVLLTFDFHPFPLDVSPGGATQGRTRITDAAPAWRDQILPKSLVKGRKTSQKCTSNAFKKSHFSAALWALIPFSCSTGTVLIPSSCLSCSLHGNWGHTAQIRSFNHYFLPSSSHFPAWQRGTIPLYLTFPRQALSSLEIPIPLYFGRIKPAILQCLLFPPTMAIFNGMSKKKPFAPWSVIPGLLFHHQILWLLFHHHQIPSRAFKGSRAMTPCNIFNCEFVEFERNSSSWWPQNFGITTNVHDPQLQAGKHSVTRHSLKKKFKNFHF